MKIHFIGIGGIGVSALARYYLEKGYRISGSDLVSSEITELFKKKGVEIFIGEHRSENLPQKTDLVIYSEAVPENNIELREAIKRKIKCQTGAQALGDLSKKYFTIAVAGMHGKGTTAFMIAKILLKGGFDPTFIIGIKQGGRFGKGKYLVLEADEYKAKFLNYHPNILVLTNIEEEHLDYFKGLKHILKIFKQFINLLPKNGVLVANKDDQNIKKILEKPTNTYSTIVPYILAYSLRQKEIKKLKKILRVPGEHNVYNALAALTVARILKIPDKISLKALSEYKGSWRRFEIKKVLLKPGFNRHLITVVSDYAHHPTEIEATLKAAREKFPRKEIWCVFQPHQYQRTYYLFDDFVKVFKEAPIDRLIITDIYDVAGREEKKIKEKISSEKLIKAINKPLAIYIPIIKKATDYLKKNLQGGEVVIIMGAGDIYKLCEQL